MLNFKEILIKFIKIKLMVNLKVMKASFMIKIKIQVSSSLVNCLSLN